MGARPVQGQSAQAQVVSRTKWGHEYAYSERVLKFARHGDIVELRLQNPSDHVWLGWPPNSKLPARNFRYGDRVTVRFKQHSSPDGLGVLGCHYILDLHKTTLLERLKLHFFHRL